MKSKALIVVAGLPGTGKSVVAHKIAKRVDALLIRTDVVRKELFARPHYSRQETRQTYVECLRRAGVELAAGRSAVVDGTFYNRWMREDARALARRHDTEWRPVLVTAAEELVRQRLARRHDDASDADFGVYLQRKGEFQAMENEQLVIRNNGDLAALDKLLDRHFGVPGCV